MTDVQQPIDGRLISLLFLCLCFATSLVTPRVGKFAVRRRLCGGCELCV